MFNMHFKLLPSFDSFDIQLKFEVQSYDNYMIVLN